ncbi:MAG: hypothetical protein LBU64_00035, partial [Planctomycetota bacterium]|jgi:hypothetical protein|nr:hypothetical protein [Planctomycetota bacterium]
LLKGYKGQLVDYKYADLIGYDFDRSTYFTYTNSDLESDLSKAYAKPITLYDLVGGGADALTNYSDLQNAKILTEIGSPAEVVIGYAGMVFLGADALSNFIPGKAALKGVAKEFFETVAKGVSNEAANNLLRNLGEKGFKELAEHIGEQGIKELGQNFSKKTLELVLKQVPKDTFKKLAKEGIDNLAENLGKEIGDIAAKKLISDKAAEQAARNLANRLVDGHAWSKHLSEFQAIGITTRKELKEYAQKIILDPKSEMRVLDNGRAAWWDSVTGTVVLKDPWNVNGGTIFRPRDGKIYFDTLR